MPYRQIQTIGGRGSSPDRFTEALRGIDVDRGGCLYAVGDSELKVFGPDGVLQRRWITEKPGWSVCVTSGTDPVIYVGQEGQVQQFDVGGRCRSTLKDDARLGLVTSVDVFGEFLLFGDVAHRCIHRYDRSGRFVNDIGRDSKAKGFLIPNGHLDFRVDDRGIIHVPNPGRHRIERYTPDGRLQGHIGRFSGTDPAGFSGCCNPTNLALWGQGNLVVTEKAPPRVKVFDTGGNLRSAFGTEAFDPNGKNMDVAVSARGAIYVVDTVRLQVCVFAAVDAPG